MCMVFTIFFNMCYINNKKQTNKQKNLLSINKNYNMEIFLKLS